jgi:hypothetical protein
MKKVLIGGVILLLAAIYVFRQRVYLRDPVATVYRDEVKQSGIQVFINNDAELLLVKDGPGAYRLLVQHWDSFPGTPVSLICLPWIACVTEANNAPKLAVASNGAGSYDPKVLMTSNEVSFVDETGAKVRVTFH